MNDQDYWTLKAMSKYGGGFVKALAQAAHQADANNRERIKNAFPEYWKEYTRIGQKLWETEGP